MTRVAVADHRFQIRIVRNLALHARDAAQLLLVIAVDHRQL